MMKGLIESLLTTVNPFNSTDEVVAWIERRNREVEVRVEEVPFADLNGWHFDATTGNLVHDSGKFFSIVGIDVRTNTGCEQHWTQPIINQPEVGYLGIICKEFDGVLYFLLQAKIEPGNVNCVQLSPTLQATRSNYTQVHGGKKPAYLEYFQNAKPDQIVLDQLQSEQGARFLRKRNRNIIIRVEEDIAVGEDFRWLTLGQIKALMRRDNTVNMDTRTVLSGLRGGEGRTTDVPLLTIDDILHRLSALKSTYELETEKIPLKNVGDWMVTPYEIVRSDRKFFRILGVNVTISNREVAQWCQPIVQPMQEGICVLFRQKINGIEHYLLQAKVECGNFDVVELAPTIQCLTGDYRTEVPERRPRYLFDYLEGRLPGTKLFETMQSEEGGRFFHEQNRNIVYELDESVNLPIYENFFWMTLQQIKEFLRFNNYLNIQVRSLISML